MKRLFSVFLIFAVIFTFSSCAGSNSQTGIIENIKPEEYSGDQHVTEDNQIAAGKILIAYFTWAENTNVADPDSIDTDATSSASLLMPGNVGLLAQWIADETGADKFSILTEDSYSSDYDECLERATNEHDSNDRPALKSKVENLDEYDIVFLGFPNWWYSCPMAILTFIDENNLAGKTIIPFCSHGTGGFAASLQDI